MASNISASTESGGRRIAKINDPRYIHNRCLLSWLCLTTPNFNKRKSMIGNWKLTPINTEVKITVLKSLLISKTLPIPKEIDLDKKISICHFIIKNPKEKPDMNKTKEKGKNPTRTLNSFFLKAGFKNDEIWKIIRGNTNTNPVATPQLMAKLMNWKGDVKTMLIPFRLKISIRNLIIDS